MNKGFLGGISISVISVILSGCGGVQQLYKGDAQSADKVAVIDKKSGPTFKELTYHTPEGDRETQMSDQMRVTLKKVDGVKVDGGQVAVLPGEHEFSFTCAIGAIGSNKKWQYEDFVVMLTVEGGNLYRPTPNIKASISMSQNYRETVTINGNTAPSVTIYRTNKCDPSLRVIK